MNPSSCPLYDRCECPLCPLEDNPFSIWYSEDEICRNPQFPTITKSMKKLKRKGAQGYFTLRMLNRDFIVRRGIEGIDPDLPDSVKNPEKEYQRREELWLRRHPEIPKTKKEEMRERGMKAIKLIQKSLSRPSVFKTTEP
ncbi:MAG: hypothetical protein QW292_10710 [Candidatus Parvarchaeota archaeon]